MLKHVFVLALICVATLSSHAYASEPTDDEIRAHHKQAMGQLGKTSGEQNQWIFKHFAMPYIYGYKSDKNTLWLDLAIELFDKIRSQNTIDPDGYEGSFGAPIGDQKNKNIGKMMDTVVGDAIQCMPMMDFVEIVLTDPELEKKYGDKAREYMEHARKMCWEKWNKRGCVYTDANGFSSYHTYDKWMDTKTKKWVQSNTGVISDNLNKHYDIGLVILRLWRLTGEEKYKQRVIEVFSRAKAMFRHLPDEDRVVWNFWMPHGPYDLKGTAPSSWVGVHSSRGGYQAGEVGFFQEVYDSGLVFDEEDFRLMVNTNRWMASTGYQFSADGSTKNPKASAIWGALSRWDEGIKKDFYAQQKKRGLNGRIAIAYQEKVMIPTGTSRRLMKPGQKAEVFEWPREPGKYLTLNCVIPNTLETVNNDRVKLITQARGKDEDVIYELVSENGKLLGEIGRVKSKGNYETILWDGVNPATGKKDLGTYKIRFTHKGEVREWPVVVIKGTKKEKIGPAQLEKGQSISVDFESELDDRWKLNGEAKVSSEQVKSGSKSLEVHTNGTAALIFGEYDDLPVKITFYAYDNGKKYGKKSATGHAWGLRPADGNVFAMRNVWRGYLNGDAEYYWTNTGQNQWFTMNRPYFNRNAGWNKWVFDFTGDKLVVTFNDKEANYNKAFAPMAKKGFVPSGAVAAFFKAGQSNAGKLYIDDILIEYP